jgi:hypothetical protein
MAERPMSRPWMALRYSRDILFFLSTLCRFVPFHGTDRRCGSSAARPGTCQDHAPRPQHSIPSALKNLVKGCSMNHSVAMAVALRCVVCCARAERGARATSNHGLEAALCCHYSRFTPRPHSEQGVEISRTGSYARRHHQGRHRLLDRCWVLERRVRQTLHRLVALAHAINTLASSGILLKPECSCSQLRFRDHSQKGWKEQNSTCHKMNLGCFITRQPLSPCAPPTNRWCLEGAIDQEPLDTTARSVDHA